MVSGHFPSISIFPFIPVDARQFLIVPGRFLSIPFAFHRIPPISDGSWSVPVDSRRFPSIPVDSRRFPSIPVDSRRFPSIPLDSRRFLSIPVDFRRIQSISIDFRRFPSIPVDSRRFPSNLVDFRWFLVNSGQFWCESIDFCRTKLVPVKSVSSLSF